MSKKPKPSKAGPAKGKKGPAKVKKEAPRLLAQNSTWVDPCPECRGRGYGCQKCKGTGAKDSKQAPGYTSFSARAMRSDPGEAVPELVQALYSVEGRERFETYTTLPERVQKLLETIDDPRQLRSLEVRIERLERVSRKAA